MTKCVGWIIPALQKRFDDLNDVVEKDAQAQLERATADQYLSKLKGSLTSEQLDLINQWEDQITFAIAREKECLYRYGLIDGIHISVSISNTELIHP